MKNISEELAAHKEFKSAARKAIFAIIFFIISYLLLLLLSIAFAIFCGILGIGLVSLKVHWLTLALGAGLIGLGLIVVFFLIKFVFKSHKVDRSNLIELREEDAPLLYEDIREIVAKVKTNFPKRIYLSYEVNACVFYDSTFLSMIFPVKKNLQVGMALVNTVSREELKAILAHEFGHFSQRSMKVGSYVYTVNQIIFNMLYDNEGYGNAIQKFANISWYFSIFVVVGVKIIEGIQWVLKKLYNVVNLHHLSLSREMEFHADAIAVNTIGSKPFISSMMRLDLSNHAFDRTLSYYEQKIASNIKPKNIYPQHQFIMNILAEDTGVDFVNGLPNVTSEYLNRYNKSKLVIKNQWASHPSTEDRIAAINNGDFPAGEDDGTPANVLFAAVANLQSAVTTLLFSKVIYKDQVSSDTFDDFEKDFAEEFKAKGFPAIFNGYYDSYNPTKIDLEQPAVNETDVAFEQLYTNEKIDILYSSFSLEADISTLKQIQTEETDIKSFEYDGTKYQKNEISGLLLKLEDELKEIQTSMSINDLVIHEYFKKKALTQQTEPVYLEKYAALLAFDKHYGSAVAIVSKIINETQFIQFTTPVEQIERNFSNFVQTETQFKEEITKLMAVPIFNKMEAELKEKLDNYLSKGQLQYFAVDAYNDDNLDVLFYALNAFRDSLYLMYFETKKALLEEMEALQLSIKQVVA